MKTVICAINSKYIHSSLAPWCLGAGIEKYAGNTEWEVVEGTINEEIDAIYERIVATGCDLVGFCTYIWNLNFVLDLAKKLKENKKVEIALGGPEVSYNQKEILESYPFVDYVLSGEGEESFARLTKKDKLEDIAGVSYRKGEKIVVKPPYVSNETPPSPYTKKYFENLNGRIAYIETSRGCPYRCAFCLSGRCGGVRFFDLEESKKNILLLANSGTKTVKFIDRTFNADKKRANEIFKLIIDEYGKNVPSSVCFHFEIEGELIDESTLEVLKKAPRGLFQFEIGLQSFNEETLNYINRKTDIEKLCDRIEKIIKLDNIHVHIDLIAGLPYEDMTSFKNSFNRAFALKPHMLQMGFLKVLHGSDMRENKEKYKMEFSKEAPYEVISTPWISEKELKKLHIIEDVFEKAYNSGRFERTIKYSVKGYDTPFDLFEGLAEHIESQSIQNNLDDFSFAFYQFLLKNKKLDKDNIRDCMALDRLSTNRMGVLPKFLKVKSPLIKKMLNILEENEETKRPKMVKRSGTILLKNGNFVYVDYKDPDKIKKSYKIYEKTIKIDEN